MEVRTMTSLLRVAVVAVPAALATIAPIHSAQATPMVAVGWAWAAGLGGLALGFLTGNAYAQNHTLLPVSAAPAAAAPVAYRCFPARVQVGGRWRRVQICDTPDGAGW
jgi:hypothetical protein